MEVHSDIERKLAVRGGSVEVAFTARRIAAIWLTGKRVKSIMSARFEHALYFVPHPRHRLSVHVAFRRCENAERSVMQLEIGSSARKSTICKRGVGLHTPCAMSETFFHSAWHASTVFALFACRLGRKLVGEEYKRVPAHPVHTHALVSLRSPLHATFRNGSPLPVKRTELTGNTNVEKLPVLAPVREPAPRLGLDDRLVHVEPGEFGRTRGLGVFAVEARVLAEEAPGCKGRRRNRVGVEEEMVLSHAAQQGVRTNGVC